jgi:hypothetical protein
MKGFIVVIILLSLTIPAFAQFGNETLTITTYYPSPHGVYGVLTMYPRDTVPNNPQQGDMYFNSGNNTLLIYVNNTVEWQPAGGSPVSTSGYKDGDVTYNQTDNQFYVYNATYNNFTQIVVSGGGGGMVTLTGSGQSTITIISWTGMCPNYSITNPHFDFIKDGMPFTFSKPPTITITNPSPDSSEYSESNKCMMGRLPHQSAINITTTDFDLVSYYESYHCATCTTLEPIVSSVWSATGN